MVIAAKIGMDLTLRGTPAPITAVQDDKYSRNLEIMLYEEGKPWIPEADTTAVIRYKCSDGTGGSYNLLPDGTVAYNFDGNTLTVALAPQVCTAPGRVFLSVSLIREGAELSTFPVTIDVQENPGLTVTSENYYRVIGALASSGWQPEMFLGTDQGGNVIVREAPDSGVSEEEVLALIPLEVSDEGYTDITGLRRLTGWAVTESASTITLDYTLEGDETHTDIIAFDESGNPVSILADGLSAVGSWTVEEATADA